VKHIYNLADLDWTVEGYTPYLWLFERLYGGMGNNAKCIDVPPIPASVPGSVQGALRQAGILPDWNIGINSRDCEWVEHRHWMYRTHLPDTWLNQKAIFRLECQGLDYSGWIYINQREAVPFKGTHLPHVINITPYLKDADNVLEIVFDLPPRWLGQFGYTSQMREWKPRFNYTWDWVPRIVQIGIWDTISLVAVEGSEINSLVCTTDAYPKTATGILEISGTLTAIEGQKVRVSLESEESVIRLSELTAVEFQQGICWHDLPVKLWWPNQEGDQPLYTVTCALLDNKGIEHDRLTRRIGFKHVDWVPCDGAPAGADPWICVINGRAVFLQGVNFAPLSANFADLKQVDYEQRLKQYQELGLNLFRINACQFLERQWFYNLCDQFGLMVWQEFPLTSSGLDNWPPEDEDSILAVAEIARSFIERRRHHVSLLLWSGGNELQGDLEGHKWGMGKPCDLNHPMLKRLQEVAQTCDPGHRYIPTSPSGPRAGANSAEFGKGIHWDVHGGAALSKLEDAEKYWASDDALFRSEVYCSGASPIETIMRYAGKFNVFPPTSDNPYWTRLTTWWIDWNRLIPIYGREPHDLGEYVAWSQALQAKMLALEMKSCKERFPRCGGILLWSGHDTFPLTINTSLIDFDGHLKPSAFAVAQIWHGPAGKP
jgi:beta-mannosidase